MDNHVNPFNADVNGVIRQQIQSNEMLDLNQPMPQKEPSVNRYKDPKFLKHQTLMMDMARSMQRKVEEKYFDKSRDEKWNKLFQEYELLYLQEPGYFMAALEGSFTENHPKLGDLISAFVKGNGDPDKIFQNLQSYIDLTTADIKGAVKQYQTSYNMAQNESDKIKNIIAEHQRRKQ